MLVLGFYLWKGLSKNLAAVPIEYAEKAVRWLREEQGIEKIAMTGASTGAGYTLICASHIPEITCIIPAEKNYPAECEAARQDSLKRIIKFIEEWQ